MARKVTGHHPFPYPPPTGGGGGGGFPAGATLRAIDGESISGGTSQTNSYYSTRGWTYANSAGWDSPSFFPIGLWIGYLQTSAKYDVYNDLGVNVAVTVTSDSDQTLAGTNSGRPNPVWWIGSLQDTPGKPLIAAAGGETVMLNVFDEPGNWTTDVSNYMTGVTGNLSSPTSTSIVTGRPLWVNPLNSFCVATLGGTPAPSTNAALYTSTVTTRDGATRHVDMGGTDMYWIAGATDPCGWCAAGGSGARVRGLGNTNASGFNQNTTSTSITIPTSFPTNITFTTTANLQVVIGCQCKLERGAGGSYAACIGTVTAYTSATGSTTIQVTGPTHTYTAIASSSGATIWLSAVDSFIWAGAVVADVTSAGRLTAGVTVSSCNASSTNPSTSMPEWKIDLGSAPATNTVQTGDTISVASTIITGGTGPFTDFSVHFALTGDQSRRALQYGDVTDMFRSYQAGQSPGGLAPIEQFLDVLGPFQNQRLDADLITPPEMNALAWSLILHGTRNLWWFNATYASIAAVYGAQESIQGTYCSTIQSGQTISRYDQMKATNYCITLIAPVINSAFMLSYVSVSPGGYQTPQNASYSVNNTPALSTSPSVYNLDMGFVDGVQQPIFECMAKWYTGTTTGIFTQNKPWIFAMYRGSGSDTNKTATFTITNTSASTVTRFYADGVIGAASNGSGGTRIKCASTAWMTTGDTAIISGTHGTVTVGGGSLNATFTLTVVDATHFDIPGAFAGALAAGGFSPTGFGVVIATHAISITGGTTFSDTFPLGTSVGIYRVN